MSIAVRKGLLATILALALLCGAASPAGAQTPPWTTFATGSALSPGPTPNVVTVGDSLIVLIGTQAYTDYVRSQLGRQSFTSDAAGASWVNYGWPGQQDGYSLIWDYANFFGARLTIGALGTNDARIMTQRPSEYSASNQYNVMANAVAETRKHSRCVMLVNVRARSVTGMSATSAQAVNNNMTWLAAVAPGGGVYVADWNAHASNSWFLPDNVHMTEAGELYYAQFIAAEAVKLKNTRGC